MNRCLDYIVGAIVIGIVKRPPIYQITSLDSFASILQEDYNISLSNAAYQLLLNRINELGIIKIHQDEYAGIFLSSNNKKSDIVARSDAVPDSSDYSVFKKTYRIGVPLIDRVFQNKQFWNDFETEVGERTDNIAIDNKYVANIPASDRIVTLTDNQTTELDDASSKLIAEVEKSNGIDGDPTFRQIVLGQLKAGRELIREQIFNAELMRFIMMDALSDLKKKYENHVIGAAAAALMELLIKHVIGVE